MSWWEREFWGKSLSSRLPQTYTPTIVKVGSLDFTPTSIAGRYWRIPFIKLVWLKITAGGTTANDGLGGSMAIIRFTLPPAEPASGAGDALSGAYTDGSSAAGGAYLISSTQLEARKHDGGNWGTGTSRWIRISGLYEVA